MAKEFLRRIITPGCIIFLALVCVLQTASCADVAPLLEWRFKTKHDANDVPTTTVSLRVNNNMEFIIEPKAIASFRVLEPKDFEAHDVPKKALTACAGWFAGGGEEYYAAYDHRRVLIYHRTLDEGLKTQHFKLLKHLPITVPKTR